jgi:glycosyltransferase involved in cell wall biosynthesis
MRVMIALEDRFFRTQNGNIYSNTISDYNFWKRYLQVFDEVVVLARVCDVSEKTRDGIPANGPGVSFLGLPYYIGAWQYMKQHYRLVAAIQQATSYADVFILRIPGRIGTLLWHRLRAENIPYAVEVIGSSKDSRKTSGANFLVRSIYGLLRGQKEQCQFASVASYVTRNYLQRAYPSNCWSTGCPDADITEEAIIDEYAQKERIESSKAAAIRHRPFRICHAGTMTALYKAQDILIKAVAICLGKGLNVELTLLGDGKYRSYFEHKAAEVGLATRVRFLGQLPPGQAVRDQLDKADIFVLPSLTEGLPGVLLEAMARGLPCIGSSVGGIPELLEPEYLVPPGDAASLANKIIEVFNDAGRLERASKRNLEESKMYHITVVNQQRIEFYKKVAELAGNRTLRK